MISTIFDGRPVWYEPSITLGVVGYGTMDATNTAATSDRLEYRLGKYSVDIRHNLLSINNIQQLTKSVINCYKDQVLVNDIRGDYATISLYPSTWGIALVTNTLNGAFAEVQHIMISKIMREGIDLKNYGEIDKIFNNALAQRGRL